MVNFNKLDLPVIFYLIIIYIGAIISPLYFSNITIGKITFLLLSYILTTLVFSIGWHRYFVHRCFKTSPNIEYFFLIIGSSIGLGSVKKWVSEHFSHHKNTDDTKLDPHSIKNGFFYAYIGWLFYEKKFEYPYKRISKPMQFQDRFVLPITIISSFIFPFILYHSIFESSFAESFIIGVCLRCAISQQTLFLLTSFSHMFGEHDKEKISTATNSKVIALITLGEGFHLNHHKRPLSFNFSNRKSEIDISAILIRLLYKFNIIWDLKR
jgi:stearoyl-CoA desaturase (delta-9 desaturase)